MELKDEGPTKCFATVVIMDRGKTNQFGRIEYGAFIRHKDAQVCPVGALAFYLFWRLEVMNEQFPDFSRRDTWYDTALINGKDPRKEVSYAMQAANLKKAMTACGVLSSKVSIRVLI